MKRPGQPAELATAYVMLADPLSSYVSARRSPSPAEGRCCNDEERLTMAKPKNPSEAAEKAKKKPGAQQHQNPPQENGHQ